MGSTPDIHTEFPQDGFSTPEWPLGYVYVAEVPGQRIRIGRTRTPYRHVPEAFTRLWISPPHLATVSNECVLRDLARRKGKVHPGHWVTGIDFDTLVDLARTLNFGTDPIAHMLKAMAS